MEPKIYLDALNTQLTYLFAFASRINEIDTAMSTSAEFRGAQDAGWNTAITAHEVFEELKALCNKGEQLKRSEIRQLLCLYAQLAEAGGVYEGLLNTMLVAQLKPWNLWPFQDLVRVRKQPRAVIGPNSNVMFRQLAETATAIGMHTLARVLEVTFRDDIRNAVAHADYIIAHDGLRLRRRNGGQPIVIGDEQLVAAIRIGIWFFELLNEFQWRIRHSYRPARTIIGRWSANPPMPCSIELTGDGAFSISSDSPGAQVDAAYVRQSHINDRLGGKMLAAYLKPGSDIAPDILAAIEKAGFDPLIIDLSDADRYSGLIGEIEEDRLWDDKPEAVISVAATLMATPFGFRWITNGEAFMAWLPPVEEMEIVV